MSELFNGDDIKISAETPSAFAFPTITNILNRHQRQIRGCQDAVSSMSDLAERCDKIENELVTLRTIQNEMQNEIKIWKAARENGMRVFNWIAGVFGTVLTSLATAILIELMKRGS